jgi:hypothetical protein
MRTFQTTVFVASFVLMLILAGGTIFSVMVEYPNWFANIPASLETTRNFYRVLHPGYFFQIVAPLGFVTEIVCVIVGWRISKARNLVLASLVILVAAELLTFFYIYPRLGIMLGPEAASQTVESLRQAAQDFTNADRIRTVLSLTSAGLSIAALLAFFGWREREAARIGEV